MVLKNIVFYGVSGPSRVPEFHLGAIKKPRVLRGFERSGGAPERTKWHVEGVLT